MTRLGHTVALLWALGACVAGACDDNPTSPDASVPLEVVELIPEGNNESFPGRAYVVDL